LQGTIRRAGGSGGEKKGGGRDTVDAAAVKSGLAERQVGVSGKKKEKGEVAAPRRAALLGRITCKAVALRNSHMKKRKLIARLQLLFQAGEGKTGRPPLGA